MKFGRVVLSLHAWRTDKHTVRQTRWSQYPAPVRREEWERASAVKRDGENLFLKRDQVDTAVCDLPNVIIIVVWSVRWLWPSTHKFSKPVSSELFCFPKMSHSVESGFKPKSALSLNRYFITTKRVHVHSRCQSGVERYKTGLTWVKSRDEGVQEDGYSSWQWICLRFLAN